MQCFILKTRHELIFVIVVSKKVKRNVDYFYVDAVDKKFCLNLHEYEASARSQQYYIIHYATKKYF